MADTVTPPEGGLTPNVQQVQSLIRNVGAGLGPILVLLGVVPAAKWATLMQAAQDSVGPIYALAGAALSVGLAIWGVLAHTSAAKRTAAAALPNTIVVVPPDIKALPDHAADPSVITPQKAAVRFAS